MWYHRLCALQQEIQVLADLAGSSAEGSLPTSKFLEDNDKKRTNDFIPMCGIHHHCITSYLFELHTTFRKCFSTTFQVSE
jgi:hypothetical protein